MPINPVIRWYDGVRETLANGDDDYPYACTVYRVVEREHFVTSNVPLLVEAMPDFFVELPEGLAEEKGIPNGSQVRVWSKRGEVQGTAIVTKRIKPLRVNGKVVWTVGIPVHWGFIGITQGSDGEPADAVHRGREHPAARSSSRSWSTSSVPDEDGRHG